MIMSSTPIFVKKEAVPRSLRVAFIVHGLGVGGLETYLLRLCTYLKARLDIQGWMLHVLDITGNGGVLMPRFQELGVHVTSQRLGLVNPVSFVRFKQFFSDSQCDIVCDMSGEFALFSLLAAKAASVPIRIVQYRNSRLQTKMTVGKTFYLGASRYVTRLFATDILSNSQDALNYFLPDHAKLKNIRCEVIRNGIDSQKLEVPFQTKNLRKELKIAENLKVVGHSGRGAKQKNHECIVAAAEKVFEKRNDVCFLLCGESVSEIVAPLIRDKPWKDRIIMPGVRSDMFDILRILDAYIFPSWFEGQPNALLEAMCAGVPFTASNVPSVVEHVPEKHHHLLHAPDDVGAFAETLLDFFETPWSDEDKNELKRKTRDYCDPETNFNRFVEILTSANNNE